MKQRKAEKITARSYVIGCNAMNRMRISPGVQILTSVSPNKGCWQERVFPTTLQLPPFAHAHYGQRVGCVFMLIMIYWTAPSKSNHPKTHGNKFIYHNAKYGAGGCVAG
jgi:hypothetical protein